MSFLKGFVAALALSMLAYVPAVAQSEVVRAKVLLSKGAPFVLVAVPHVFLTPDKIEGDEIETQSDWAHYLDDWTHSHRDIPIVAISLDDYRKLIVVPVAKDCINLFVRGRKAAIYDSECVAVPYDEGLLWMRSGRLAPNVSLRVMKIHLRQSRH